MYGLEYYSQATLINEKNENNVKISSEETETIKNSQTMNLMSFNFDGDTSDVTEQLSIKLQNLRKCPEYLIQKEVFNINIPTYVSRSSPSTHRSLTATLNSNKSTSSCANKYYTDDFIFLSEFSEIEGPKPLLTIPTDGGTGFNKNEYSLHLMCVDFHSHLQRPSSIETNYDKYFESGHSQQCYAPNTSNFSLSKDTTIINYYDFSSSVAACVHHFTLYDLEARGFVRPFCLAYVSYDKSKPVIYFEQIRQKFNEITNLFKRSNYNLFKLEIEQQLADLKYTRELFIKWSTKHNDDIDGDRLKKQRNNLAERYNLSQSDISRLTSSSSNVPLQLKTIDNLTNELENVLNVINIELKSKNWIIKNVNESSQSIKDRDNETQTIKLRSMTYPTDDKPRQKHLFDSFKTQKLFINILIGINNKKNIDTDQDRLSDDFISERSTGGIDFHNLNHSQQRKTMKRLHQLSMKTAKNAINEMRLMHSYFTTPYYLIKFRDIDKNKIDFSTINLKILNYFWSFIFGNSVIDDFSTNIESMNLDKYSLIKKDNSSTNELYHNQTDCSVTINNNEIQSDFANMKSLSKTEFHKNNIFKSVPISLRYFENFFDETLDKTSSANHFGKDDSDMEHFETTSEYEVFGNTNEYDFVNSLMNEKESPGSIRSIPSYVNTSASKIYAEFNKCKDIPSLTDTLIDMIKFNFEETLLRLSKQYNEFLPHILYSILKGRPVICISRYCQDQTNLVSIVETLSHFVPNSFHNLNELISNVENLEVLKLTSSPYYLKLGINPFQNSEKKHRLMSIYERKPIKLNDLKYCKVFGLSLLITKNDQCCSADCNSNKSSCKRSFFVHNHKHYHVSNHQDDTDLILKFIPITVRNYVSIFDLDKGTFVGPRYHGTHLTNTLHKGRHLKQDSIFYLHLINHMIKYYLRIAFIFNYSILFEEEFQMKKRLDSCSRQSNSSTSIRDRDFFQKSNSSYNAKRERIMRYFSSHNKNNSTQSNKSLSASRDILGFFSKSRRNSKVNSNIYSINELITKQANFSKNSSQLRQSLNSNNKFELLKMLLSTINYDSNSDKNSLKSEFSNSDFIIVKNLLKTIQIKQIYLYNIAMQNKFEKKDLKEKNENSTSLSVRMHDTQCEQIPYPLIIDFEEISVFTQKKNE